ncbi:MAG: hypothetical protein AAGJ82_06020 [Bacteroidota bacterium]
MSRILTAALLSVLLFTGCREDFGESLFVMDYPPQLFTLEAGQNVIPQPVFVANNILTNYDNFRDATNTAETDVTRIQPRYARLVSENGFDFGFLDQVEIRICAAHPTDPCVMSEEVFFIDDLYRRNITTINFAPGLRNVKDLLEQNVYKLEVIFFPGEIVPSSVECRLEYGFEAFK